MAKPRTEAQRFVPRPLPGGDATRYVHRSVSSGGYDHHARVVLHAPLETLAARLPPQVGTLTSLGPDRCLFTTASDCLHSLAVYIGLFGVDFEVQEPSALIEQLATLHQRIGRALEASATTPARDADPSNDAKITY